MNESTYYHMFVTFTEALDFENEVISSIGVEDAEANGCWANDLTQWFDFLISQKRQMAAEVA